MTNQEIAKTFQLLGNIMELHGENPFKISSYRNAYITLRKLDKPLLEMSDEDISGIKGVGKAISAKIGELLETGKMATLQKYLDQTPEGIQEMLNIKGFGPKKIYAVWKKLGVETIGELLYAVNENRLMELKGFGQKTQEELRQKLEYYQKSKNKFHYAALEDEARGLLKKLKAALPQAGISFTGAIYRRCNILEDIEFIIAYEGNIEGPLPDLGFTSVKKEGKTIFGITDRGLSITIHSCEPAEFGSKLFRYSASKDFLDAFLKLNPGMDFKGIATEEEVFQKAGLPYIPPELREADWSIKLALKDQLPKLIEETDIKGVIHTHTTFSDGLHSLADMAACAKEMGYSYIGISDHSKAAFYANGLQPGRVIQQMEEIDQLNEQLAPFKIFKGIESDILNDGSLDYEEELLRQFDFVIASVHSNLRMDEEKSGRRLIRAIENPYTNILGHPTGRLLLSRKGYPLDHVKIIDACAENGVAIELNANPYRLDLDWSWIPYALEKGVLISINPDAHSKGGIKDIRYGVLSARKGGLTAEACLNAKNAEGFERFCSKTKHH